MIRELYKEVEELLIRNKEYTNEQMYLLLAYKRGFKTPNEFYDAIRLNQLDFTVEGVGRTARKLMEHNQNLRSEKYIKYSKRKEKEVKKEVIEITKEQREIKEFATKNIQQGSLLWVQSQQLN